MFNPDRHYPLLQLNWDSSKAQQTIVDIANETISQFEKTGSCPVHPMDGYGFGSDLYFGAAGVLWTLAYFQDIEAIDSTFNVAAYLDATSEKNRESYKNLGYPDNSSFLVGELPILLLQYKLSPSEDKATEILQSVQKNHNQPIRELMWGMAGSMLAIHFMYQWTRGTQWAEEFKLQADLLLREWEPVDKIGFLWTVDLYGSQQKYLGPVHGFAGNLIPLIVGRELISDSEFKDISSKAMKTVINTAISDHKHANWAAVFEVDSSKTPELVQYCHGAAGMVVALSALPTGENEFDRILEKGGELTWDAGPLKKGSNLCHGTAGNGYAFLKLFDRTGNEMWLDRARAFAMHAIEQYKLSKDLYGQLRYPLWTGDLGLAIYLWDCNQAQAKFPTIDVF